MNVFLQCLYAGVEKAQEYIHAIVKLLSAHLHIQASGVPHLNLIHGIGLVQHYIGFAGVVLMERSSSYIVCIAVPSLA